MKRHTGTFIARGSDGRDYTVHVYTEYISAGSFDDPDAVIEGMKGLHTSTGQRVNRLGKGQYQIVSTGVALRSDSPEAF